MVRAPTPCAYRGRKPLTAVSVSQVVSTLLLARIAAGSRTLTTEYRRAAATNAARGLMTAAVIEN